MPTLSQHQKAPASFGVFGQQQRPAGQQRLPPGVIGRRPQSSRSARASATRAGATAAALDGAMQATPPPSVHLDKVARQQQQRSFAVQPKEPPPAPPKELKEGKEMQQQQQRAVEQRGLEGVGETSMTRGAESSEGASSSFSSGVESSRIPADRDSDRSTTRRSTHESAAATHEEKHEAGSSADPEPWRQGPVGGVSGEDTVNIRVYDERRKVTREFASHRALLMDRMGYFRTYLAHVGVNDDIDIEVHCDVGIFEWLMKFIHSPTDRPPLTAESVVSIMVSSDFLEMPELVDECLEYLKSHMSQVVVVPLDLSCVTAALTHRLAEMFSDVELDDIQDDQDRLLSKLFMHKLENLLETPADTASSADFTLKKCARCETIFTSAQHAWMVCPKSPVEVDFHGNVVARHVACEEWDVQRYLVKLRRRRLPWKHIYWRTWGIVHSLHCSVCNERFPLWQYHHCSFHPRAAVFEGAENFGIYPCCQQQAVRFSTGLRTVGCEAGCHQISDEEALSEGDKELLKKLRGHLEMVTVAFGRSDDPFHTGSSSESDSGSEEDDAVEDTQVLAKIAEPRANVRGVMNHGTQGKRHGGGGGMARRKQPMSVKGETTPQGGKKKGRGGGGGMRGFKPEFQRDEDLWRMEAMTRELEALRRDDGTPAPKQETSWMPCSANPPKDRPVCSLPPRLGARAYLQNQAIRASVAASMAQLAAATSMSSKSRGTGARPGQAGFSARRRA